ncbi:MAG: hypothetical protein OEQ47_11565, partial [Acidimicrobiia bacterium]|nr:hypothetical protein [Acidimicrobiia bacterium]
MSRLETLLHDALVDAGTRVEPSPDLFERVQAGIAADQNRRRSRRRIATTVASLTAFAATATVAFVYQQGEPHMDWWILEIIAAVVLGTIALVLGPFIKRFGRSYAADVFRSNPSTGKSFIVLTDFAYYLIFTAYIAFTTTIDRPRDWPATVGAEQVQHNIIRLGGILLIIGVLHGVNLLVLPIIGRLLTLNRRLDQQMRDLGER